MNSTSDSTKIGPEIDIDVDTQYIDEYSRPEDEHFTFGYTITITNNSEQPVKLLSRHWVITDANNDVQEVHGEGVVGEQPHIGIGKSFRYSSGAVLKTEIGSMEGSYQMLNEDGSVFDADIPVFSLHKPGALH